MCIFQKFYWGGGSGQRKLCVRVREWAVWEGARACQHSLCGYYTHISMQKHTWAALASSIGLQHNRPQPVVSLNPGRPHWAQDVVPEVQSFMPLPGILHKEGKVR